MPRMTARPCFVYMATSPSGRSYVGVSVDPEHRWKAHVRAAHQGSELALHRAIRKYGAQSFRRRVIFEAGGANSSAVCFRAEKVFVSTHGTLHPHGYNLLEGGDTGSGYSRATAEHHRSKIVEALSRPEVRQKMSERAKAYFASAAAREKASEKAREFYSKNPEARARMSALKVVAFDPAHQQRMAAAARAAMQEPAERARRAACARRTALDPAVRAAINAAVARPVVCVDTGGSFTSVSDAVRWLQSSGKPLAQKSKVSQAASGKAKSAYGFQWKYVDRKAPP